MDVISSETSDENGCIERPVRTRRSSILKPPRSPLQDLNGGNERVQESNALRNKKNTRRVSFADTIKVFQTESHVKFKRNSEHAETEAGENVPFIQNKNLDDNYCEITGMDTLLCAPIQAQMQHREISITELNHERKHENDQTVIFSDENQMDLTASHTVIINNDPLDCTKGQKSNKIDTSSFLANLKLHTENSRMKNEFKKISMDQNTSSENKINFSDFIKNLKREKSNDFPSSFSSNKENYFSSDKENIEVHTYSKNSNRTSTMYQKHASLNVEENSTNMTRIFRDQDDGMNFTQCHTANIQTLVPSANEARLREFKCDDTTIYGNDFMDLTVNHTIQILPSVDNLSKSESQTKDVWMDGTTHCGTDAPEKKTVFKNKLNDALNPECKTDISRSHIIRTEIDTVTPSSNQETRTLAMTSESTLFSPGRQDYKTVFYSTCNDAMELTKCVSIKEKNNLLNHDSNFSNMYPNPDAISLFIDKTIYSGETSMDITKSHTVAIDNQIFKQDQTNVQMAAIPVSEKEVAKKTPAISENGGMIVNCSSVSHVSKERLQQSLGNPLSISLIDKKTEIFMNEDMDLTESHTTNLGCQPSLTSSNPAPENICKRNSHSKSPSDEWVFLSEGQSALKNPNTTVNSHTLKSIPDQNSKLPDPPRKSLGNPIPGCLHNKATVCSEEKQNMDLTKSHTVVIGFVPSEEQKLGKTNLEYINSQLTTVSRQIAVDVEKCINVSIEKKCIANDMDILEVKSVQKSGLLSEKKDVEICERKSGSLKVDKTIVFSEIDENDMDITKSCTVETNHRPFLEHDSCLMPLAGTSKTVLYSCGQDDMEITRSHTTILQCKTLSPDKITTRPMDKTIIFVDNQDELEMTKSHTVFNVFHTNEKTAPLDRSNCELYKKNSLEKPKVVSVPAEESAFFQKNDEGDHSAAKVSRLTLAGEWSNTGSITKAVEVIDDDMKVSKSNIWEYNQDIQRPGLLNEPPGKGQKRKSLRLKNDKTIAFSKSDDDMDIGQSCMMKRNNESALKDGEDSRLLPLAGTSKTILYTDDMEITKSYTTALEYKTLSPDKKTTRPMNNSVMFVDNQSALEVTKSHTVFIDCPATRDFLQKCPEFGIAKRKTLDASFPEGGRSVQDVTKNQEEARESSHETAICGSIDNHSSLSNVSCFKNLHGNDKFLSDKTKKSSDYPMQNDLTFANNLAVEYYSKSEGQPLSACLSEKEKFIQTKGQLDYAITLFKDQDLIKDSKNQLADQTLVYSQDLGKMTIINSEQVSLKIPEAQKEPFINNAAHDVKKISVDNVCLVSQPHFTTQQLPSLQQGQCIVNKDETIFSKAVNNLDTVPRNSSVPAFENKSKILNSEKKFAVACEKEQEKNIETAQHHTAVDFSNNPDLTKQFNETLANPREESDSIISSNIESYNIKPNLNDLNGTDFKTAPISCSPEQLFELVNRAHGNMVQATEIHNISTVTNKVNDDGAKENNTSHNVAKANPVPRTVRKDKVKRYSLGIFLPRLPNKRNCSVTDMDDLDQMPADAADLNCVETQPVSGKASGIGFVTTELNLSPSQYINEENLPIDPGEINFLDSISLEMDEKALSETNQKEISSSENKMEENCNSHKRTWVQEEYDTQNEKKIKKHDIRFTDTTIDQKISDDHAEGNIDKTTNSVSRTPSSCSSSLDSIKADGTSLDFSTHRNSQMESQFLTDTICEESLKEKLKDGRITLKEFFILLQVHILIQKPRQSKLPAKFTVNSPATPEDLMLSQYVYRPKIQIYKEDCDALHQKIEELKLSALNQDKLLTDVNKNLWEKMKHCSDEELKAFGNYLNKIKSRFTKMTKVFTHQGKVTLYSKLVQSAKNEREKLQIRINKMDNTLKKIDNCLTEVEIETKDLDCEEKDNTIKGWDSEMRAAEKELEQLKTKEEELKRNLLELEVQRGQILNQIDSIQKQTSKTNELLDQLSLSEWDVIEWSDDQAVFTFLYDTIELNIIFGETEVGLPFLDKSSRKIIDLNFQSLLDENEAPSSSLLVHKLIFQYIEGQESWKKKCATQLQVPKMLQEISLIVSHCRLLGEEIEFLKRWGANYNLMSIDVNNTELKLLFSSSAAFAKFEITLSLSACYPSVPLPFTFQNHIGNIGKDKITAILSKVPLEDNYLKNVVKQIYQDLLQNCSFYSIDGPRQYQA